MGCSSPRRHQKAEQRRSNSKGIRIKKEEEEDATLAYEGK